jgi:hypothetical protein
MLSWQFEDVAAVAATIMVNATQLVQTIQGRQAACQHCTSQCMFKGHFCRLDVPGYEALARGTMMPAGSMHACHWHRASPILSGAERVQCSAFDHPGLAEVKAQP